MCGCVGGVQNFKLFPSFVERLRGLCGESVVKEEIAYKEYVYNFDDKCPQYIQGAVCGSGAHCGGGAVVLTDCGWIEQVCRTMKSALATSSPDPRPSRASRSRCQWTVDRNGRLHPLLGS